MIHKTCRKKKGQQTHYNTRSKKGRQKRALDLRSFFLEATPEEDRMQPISTWPAPPNTDPALSSTPSNIQTHIRQFLQEQGVVLQEKAHGLYIAFQEKNGGHRRISCDRINNGVSVTVRLSVDQACYAERENLGWLALCYTPGRGWTLRMRGFFTGSRKRPIQAEIAELISEGKLREVATPDELLPELGELIVRTYLGDGLG